MKTKRLHIIIIILLLTSSFAYPDSTEYANTRYLDLTGDFKDEVIIEAHHNAGTNHYIEDLRIFKDEYPDLKLVFHIRTLDSYWGISKPFDAISEVSFTEPDPETGLRSIFVKSKKIYYNDEQNKIVDREEGLPTKVFSWNGENFTELDSKDSF